MKSLLTAVPLLLALGACSSDAAGEPDVGDEYGAQVMCEKFVKDRLKSPSSAEFDSEPGTRSGKAWVVEGVVDSENSFGAMIRSDFTCKIKYLGDDEWKLQRLDGLD